MTDQRHTVVEPIDVDGEIESITIELDDGRTVTYSQRDGIARQSRVYPDVLAFEQREVSE